MESAPEVLLANALAEPMETPSISIRSARNKGWLILLFLIVLNVLGRVVLVFSSLASLVGITKQQNRFPAHHTRFSVLPSFSTSQITLDITISSNINCLTYLIHLTTVVEFQRRCCHKSLF